MQTLVLGATGFIGGHIAKEALEQGWKVRALRRTPASVGHLNGLPVEWVPGDLNDTASLAAAMQDVDTVFHAAAYYPTDSNPRKVPAQVRQARQEIANVLNAARQAGVRRLIYTSSLSTIGQPPANANRLADERDVYQPGSLAKSGYYEAKIVMEQAVLQAADDWLDAVVLCPTAVFGPGDVHLSIGGLLIAVARGLAIAWLPGEINVVDVRDVAAAHIAAVEHGRRGERYIIGGHNYTVRQALEIAARVAGVRPPRFGIPMAAIKALIALGDTLPFLPLPANHLRALPLWQGYNTAKAQRELGLSPRPFEETVRDALAWFREHGYL
ncbi:MAG: NAD-dependent epimerase/dehydratase family protein [Anaerolineae bacterium]|nr:MAG: NAD-dependent epimerase/dehydratase family protein [Anaerolineae bacterium]